MKKLLYCFLLFSLTVLPAACGFTLRGSADLPDSLQTLRLEALDSNSDIVREMRRALINSGVTLAEEGAEGVYRLGIGREQVAEEVISVNTNARAGEYELRMSVPFQLRNEDFVIPRETITLEQVYVADPDNAVAKSEEAARIREEMRREIVAQILRRLQSVNPDQ